MTQELLSEFHPSVRDAVAVWLNTPAEVERHRAYVRAHHVETIRIFPALAVMSAHGMSRWRAADRGLCERPKKYLKGRFARGVDIATPARQLRLREGWKYLTVYAVSENDDPTKETTN